jgi:hypothetical protein
MKDTNGTWRLDKIKPAREFDKFNRLYDTGNSPSGYAFPFRHGCQAYPNRAIHSQHSKVSRVESVGTRPPHDSCPFLPRGRVVQDNSSGLKNGKTRM